MNETDGWQTVHPLVRLAARLAKAPEPVHLPTLDRGHDRPTVPGGVTDSLVIATSPRSGSNLLVYTLRDAGFGVGDEFWSDRVMWAASVRWGVPRPTMHGLVGQARRAFDGQERWWLHRRFTEEQFRRYQRLLEAHRTSANGVFVVKLFRPDVEELERRNGLRPADVLPGRRHWVHLVRDDSVLQAVSFFRAMRTDVWVDTDGTRQSRFDLASVTESDIDEIARRVQFFRQTNAWWDRQFARYEVEPLRITYEELETEFAATMDRVVRLLGHEFDECVPAATIRQRDEVTDALRQRLLHRHPDIEAGP